MTTDITQRNVTIGLASLALHSAYKTRAMLAAMSYGWTEKGLKALKATTRQQHIDNLLHEIKGVPLQDIAALQMLANSMAHDHQWGRNVRCGTAILCPHCTGTGGEPGNVREVCSKCYGSGVVEKRPAKKGPSNMTTPAADLIESLRAALPQTGSDEIPAAPAAYPAPYTDSNEPTPHLGDYLRAVRRNLAQVAATIDVALASGDDNQFDMAFDEWDRLREWSDPRTFQDPRTLDPDDA